jgi:hypothetical protein
MNLRQEFYQATHNLMDALVEEADAKINYLRYSRALEEAILGHRIDAIEAAQRGDETSPLYKVAATSQAWKDIADRIPQTMRLYDTSLDQLYRETQQAEFAYIRAQAEVQRFKMAVRLYTTFMEEEIALKTEQL